MHDRRNTLQRDLASSVASAVRDLAVVDRRDVVAGKPSSGTARLDELGLPELRLSEDDGGLGLGWAEVRVVNAEIGRALVSPEAVLAASVASAVDDPAVRAAGLRVGVALSSADRSAWWTGDGLGPLWAVNGAAADLLVVVSAGAVVVVDTQADGVTVEPCATVSVPGVDAVVTLDVTAGRVVEASPELIRAAGAVASAAQAVASADRVLELLVEHVKVREQFGRPIGAFQSIAHRCAAMKVDLELVRSQLERTTDLLDAGPVPVDEALALRAAVADRLPRLMRDALHVFGGIGFTAEHDLHLHLKHVDYLAATFGDAAETRRLLARRRTAAVTHLQENHS